VGGQGAAVVVEDEGVDAGEAGVAAGVGEARVDGEGPGEEGPRLGGRLPAEGLGELDRGGRVGLHAGDAEVATLAAEPAGVGLVPHVVLEAVGPVEPHGDLLAVGQLHAKAVAVGPVGGHERAALDHPEFLGHRGRRIAGRQDCDESGEQGGEEAGRRGRRATGRRNVRHAIYGNRNRCLRRIWVRIPFRGGRHVRWRLASLRRLRVPIG